MEIEILKPPLCQRKEFESALENAAMDHFCIFMTDRDRVCGHAQPIIREHSCLHPAKVGAVNP